MWIARVTGCCAICSLLLQYLADLSPSMNQGAGRVATVTTIVGGLTLLHVLGIRRAAAFGNLVTLAKLLPLLLFVVIGVFHVGLLQVGHAPAPINANFAKAVLLLSVAFVGCESVVVAAGRMFFGPAGASMKVLMYASLMLGLAPAYSRESASESSHHAPVHDARYDERNFDGVWNLADGGKFGPVAVREGVNYVVYPYTPEYQALYDQRLADAAAGNPYQTAGTTCLPSGAIRLLTGGGPPLEIFHTPQKIAILKENGGWSRVYLNRGHLPSDELYPMFYGDSIGHWEGNTLVVDTISLGGANNIDGTAPHSDAAHLIQRISRPSRDTLRLDATLEDPKALLHPVTTTALLKRLEDADFTESFCTNERNVRDRNGRQTVKFGK